MKARSPYLALEARIARDEHGGILHRWQYGRKLLEAKAGRRRLPDGLLDDLVKAAEAAGLVLSRREIQYRLTCAEVYDNDQQLRSIAAQLGSWRALCDAGFPAVEVDESDLEPDELETAGISTGAADEFEQLSLIPGLAPVLSVHGRKVPLAEATVADVEAYRDMYRQIHENYGKRLALIEAALEAMREGSEGDDDANALEAWKRGTGDEDERDEPEADAA